MSRGNYKSILEVLEDDTFDVGASSDPAKLSKLLKNIETYSEGTTTDGSTYTGLSGHAFKKRLQGQG